MTIKKYSLPILLFDSECSLCNRFKQALEKLPGTNVLTMVSIHDEYIYDEYPLLDKSECHEELHIIDEKGQIYKGSEAIAHLTTRFPGVSKFAWLAQKGVGKKTVDYFYKMANRYRKESLQNGCPNCK